MDETMAEAANLIGYRHSHFAGRNHDNDEWLSFHFVSYWEPAVAGTLGRDAASFFAFPISFDKSHRHDFACVPIVCTVRRRRED